MAPSTQKAVLLESKCGNYVLGTAPVPKPGPGDILIKVQAAALNPVDYHIQRMGIFFDTFPAIVGTDIAGDVEEVGEGVTDFKKGDRVLVQSKFQNEYGSFQQYALGLTEFTAKVGQLY